VILKFLGCPYPPGSPEYRSPESYPLVAGEKYEVAEIYEAQEHLMVRPVGAARWPVPGDPWFGWHPEWFEPTAQPIPIVSCGFYYNTTLTGFYGVILQRAEHIELVRELDEVDWPNDDEPFEEWHERAARALPFGAAELLYRLLEPHLLLCQDVYEHVFLADHHLGPVGPRFAYVGTFLQDLARHDVRKHEFGERLGEFLYAMGIQDFEVDEINFGFWQGTRGGDRLINAPPDGRCIYGTDNEPDSDD
jgi:hypothetical protein